MPRQLYRITPEDFIHARSYLIVAMNSGRIEFIDDDNIESLSEARRQFTNLNFEGKKSAPQLQEWCEKYLSNASWTKLKFAIRQRRLRWTNFENMKQVTISAKAHKLLQQLANRDKVTFSEVLEKVLARNLANAQGAMARRKPR